MVAIFVVYCIDNGNMTSDITAFYDENLAGEYCKNHSNSSKNIYYFYNRVYISDSK